MRATRFVAVVVSALALGFGSGALAGCGHGSSGGPGAGPGGDAAPIEAGIEEAGVEAAPPCFTNPTTYLEIINACTDAQAVDKTDDLSVMNLPDGGLAPLP